VPSPLPDGEPAPPSGLLPVSAGVGSDRRKLGLYIHVPFCAVRCGYCDFNTYTAQELDGVSQASYPAQAMAEMTFAKRVLDDSGVLSRPLSTVFLGGGTPTLLGPEPLAAMLGHARETFGLASDAEVTVEANPDSVSARDLQALAGAGVTRVSFGVQSSDPSVLATLDRTHDPERVPFVIQWARDTEVQVSVDLIYGTPGETLESWRATLQSALEAEPDHISAYALIVEKGTALAARISRGELSMPDDDLHAEMYTLADQLLLEAGYGWYEVSNWARTPAHRSRHNLSYWTSEDWWGIGPGAHSHVGGVRWWNVKHPSAYAARIGEGVSPAQAREVLGEEVAQMERVLLGIRLRSGVEVSDIAPGHHAQLAEWVSRGLLDGRELLAGRVVPTLQGRLVADFLARELT
jgi:putative oxygen-independent coproporphyrinogen III oxidase